MTPSQRPIWCMQCELADKNLETNLEKATGGCAEMGDEGWRGRSGLGRHSARRMAQWGGEEGLCLANGPDCELDPAMDGKSHPCSHGQDANGIVFESGKDRFAIPLVVEFSVFSCQCPGETDASSRGQEPDTDTFIPGILVGGVLGPDFHRTLHSPPGQMQCHCRVISDVM